MVMQACMLACHRWEDTSMSAVVNGDTSSSLVAPSDILAGTVIIDDFLALGPKWVNPNHDASQRVFEMLLWQRLARHNCFGQHIGSDAALPSWWFDAIFDLGVPGLVAVCIAHYLANPDEEEPR